MKKLRQIIHIFMCGLIVAFAAYFTIRPFSSQNVVNSHNCRFWGIIFSKLQSPSLESTIRTQLDSLKSLGNNNPDGWGIGYYLSPVPDSSVILPVVSRGEPSAPLDPRYDKVVDDMTNYMKKCGIAHVRSGTSGPTGGIPNPHPFQRDAVHRDFQMLFAHNGSIAIKVLLELIQTMNPAYLGSNPPDYEPDYLDSDLYSIYIMEIIDMYLNNTIEECITIAVTKLDSALGPMSAQLNFVMSDGSTLWALRFTKSLNEGFTLYYYPHMRVSDFWIAASEPLDTLDFYWAAVPNSTLVVLKPNERPQFINILGKSDAPHPNIHEGLNLIYPNPFREKIDIRWQLTGIEQSAEGIELKIYDATGRLVKDLFRSMHSAPCPTHITWDGKDNGGNNLPNGIYFCNLSTEDTSYIRKIVLIK